MANAKTMIQVDVDVRDKIKSLGRMGETYSDVLGKLYKLAILVEMEKYLMDVNDYTDINDLV
jgi:hypothetical protein